MVFAEVPSTAVQMKECNCCLDIATYVPHRLGGMVYPTVITLMAAMGHIQLRAYLGSRGLAVPLALLVGPARDGRPLLMR